MLENLTSKQLFVNSAMNLTNIYKKLNTEASNGLTQKELEELEGLTSLDLPFANFLSQNIGKIDTNKNSVVSEDELNKYLSDFVDKGMTIEEIYALSANGMGVNKTLLETVMANFSDMDTNKDGKLTLNEIDSFMINKELGDRKDKVLEADTSHDSIFYSDSAEAEEEEA